VLSRCDLEQGLCSRWCCASGRVRSPRCFQRRSSTLRRLCGFTRRRPRRSATVDPRRSVQRRRRTSSPTTCSARRINGSTSREAPHGRASRPPGRPISPSPAFKRGPPSSSRHRPPSGFSEDGACVGRKNSTKAARRRVHPGTTAVRSALHSRAAVIRPSCIHSASSSIVFGFPLRHTKRF